MYLPQSRASPLKRIGTGIVKRKKKTEKKTVCAAAKYSSGDVVIVC